MSGAPFCTMDKSEGRYKYNSALTILLDRSMLGDDTVKSFKLSLSLCKDIILIY